MKYFEKISEQKYEDLGFVDSMKAITSATGGNNIIDGRALKGWIGIPIGALTGLGISSLFSKNPKTRAASLLGGALIGNLGGVYKADKEYLTKRGIKPRASYLLTGKVSISPEAKKKYLNK